jgi:hypothetical protein
MQIKMLSTAAVLGIALGLSGTAAFAASGMEDATTRGDEAAEAEDRAAEAREEAAVTREEREDAQAKKFTAEELSGDMNPVDEADSAQIKEPE